MAAIGSEMTDEIVGDGTELSEQGIAHRKRTDRHGGGGDPPGAGRFENLPTARRQCAIVSESAVQRFDAGITVDDRPSERSGHAPPTCSTTGSRREDLFDPLCATRQLLTASAASGW